MAKAESSLRDAQSDCGGLGTAVRPEDAPAEEPALPDEPEDPEEPDNELPPGSCQPLEVLPAVELGRSITSGW